MFLPDITDSRGLRVTQNASLLIHTNNVTFYDMTRNVIRDMIEGWIDVKVGNSNVDQGLL